MSRSRLNKEQIEDLLDNVLDVYVRNQWKGDKIQFTCPVHGEKNPSCGINIDYSPSDQPFEHFQVFHCFSCGAGGSIPWLLHKALPERFQNVKKAEQFIKDRYGVSFSYSFDSSAGNVRRYEDQIQVKSKRFEMPRTKLAVFKSGKETYEYFFERGFDKEDMKEYMIGRDLKSETVTIPAFWEDGALAGVIGRYIDPDRPKNARFRIYDFPKGKIIFPLDKVRAVNNTIIGLESMFDAMMLRKWGHPNAVSMMGDGMGKEQADQIADRCTTFIDLFDNDKGGRIAREIAKKRLGNRVLYLVPTYYPPTGKDPCDWGEIETNKVINSAKLFGGNTIPRL